MELLYAWRAEIAVAVSVVLSWLVFTKVLKRNFGTTFWPGVLMGCMIEFMTEPEWTYFVKLYLWRDVSPMIILGWGVIFSWLIVCSDALHGLWFRNRGSGAYAIRRQKVLTDFAVGMPLILGNELFGLYGIKVWQYNDILGWTSMIPMLHYPLEGLYSMVFFVLASPFIIRYWERTALP